MGAHSLRRYVLFSVCVVLLFHYCPFVEVAGFVGVSDLRLSLSANPSAVVIKVGENATINLSLTSSSTSGEACLGEEGFPNSGFILTFLPQCTPIQQSVTRMKLVVEATPAAAPQNFTALIVATVGNETASTPLTVTVVPAIPAWIPWLGILLFFIVIEAALFVRPKKPDDLKEKHAVKRSAGAR